jgi:hypothetical protein
MLFFMLSILQQLMFVRRPLCFICFRAYKECFRSFDLVCFVSMSYSKIDRH